MLPVQESAPQLQPGQAREAGLARAQWEQVRLGPQVVEFHREAEEAESHPSILLQIVPQGGSCRGTNFYPQLSQFPRDPPGNRSIVFR